MKVAALWSSPNTEGLTASAKERFLAGMRKKDAEITEIHLNAKTLQHCRACGNGWGLCRSEGRCVLKDDFEDIYRQLAEADGIALISAVYWHDITEAMKAFVDRLRRCETGHNRFLAGKRCFLVACAGGTGRGAVTCLHLMEESLQHMGMQACDRLPVTRFNQAYILPALEHAGELYAARLAEGFDRQD